ncbi:MAG: hypothetical protein KDK36_17510, partial [Leptospiraceae bacterium]|nr:hypothetical protein [Leptospiraceae bacterium]
MNKLGVPVAIEDIEINMEGRPLSDTEVKLFENNYRNYIKDSEKTKDVFEETIEEIANLLSVNQTNFDKVQKQKWFSRSWNTITGKNKKLEKQSLLNLQKVQKGALFFLQNLAERNQETMESVIFAIKRIEDMQLESMKLKGYLTNIVIKYNSRLKKIESRLDDHDFAIKQLNKSKSNISLILFAVLFFIAAILLFILTEKIETKWVLSSILFIISIFMIYSGKNNQKDLNDKIEIGNETDSLTEIQKENLELRSQLNENLINVYPKIILTNDFFDSPFEDFFKTVNEIAKYYGSISSDMEKENFSEVIRKIIELEIVNSHTINTMIQKNLSYFIELNSEFNQKIINNYLPESIGLDVLI